MNTDELTNTRYLEHGDIVTINGEKYLCEEQSSDEDHCRYCIFNGYKCFLPKELGYECSSNWVAMISIEDIIERELKEIDEHQRYIKYLKEL